ncbi:hypothetical protein BG006_003506, partial [Podila minutissima]
ITGLGGETRREQEHENDDYDDDDGGEKCALQHAVYDQLAQLTRLRRLDLSIVCTCKVPSYVPAELYVYLYRCLRHRHRTSNVVVGSLDTLQFSLSLRLARLLGLSPMEELGDRGVDHRIRRDELIRMQEHWPRLRWI